MNNLQQGWKEQQLKKRKFAIDSVIYALKLGVIEIEKHISKEKKEMVVSALIFGTILYSLTSITALMR